MQWEQSVNTSCYSIDFWSNCITLMHLLRLLILRWLQIHWRWRNHTERFLSFLQWVHPEKPRSKSQPENRPGRRQDTGYFCGQKDPLHRPVTAPTHSSASPREIPDLLSALSFQSRLVRIAGIAAFYDSRAIHPSIRVAVCLCPMVDSLSSRSSNPSVWMDHTMFNYPPPTEEGLLSGFQIFAMTITCIYSDFTA